MKRGRPPKAKIPEIEQQYDYDRFVGKGFFKTLPEILSKRFAEGWKYIEIFNLGKDYTKSIDGEYPVLFGVLYEKQIVTIVSQLESLCDNTSDTKNKFTFSE